MYLDKINEWEVDKESQPKGDLLNLYLFGQPNSGLIKRFSGNFKLMEEHLRKVLADEAKPSKKVQEFLANLADEKRLYRGMTTGHYAEMKELPRLVSEFQEKYPNGCARHIPKLKTIDLGLLWDLFYLRLQDKAWRKRKNAISLAYSQGRLMELLQDNPIIENAWKKQLEVSRLVQRIGNPYDVRLWEKRLKANPEFSELCVFIRAMLPVGLACAEFNSVALKNVSVEAGRIMFRLPGGSLVFPLKENREIQILDLLSLLSWDETAVSGFRNSLAECQKELFEKKGWLSKTPSLLYSPAHHSFLSYNFFSSLSEDVHSLIRKDRLVEEGVITIFEGNHILFYDKEKFALIAQDQSKDSESEALIINLFGQYLESARQAERETLTGKTRQPRRETRFGTLNDFRFGNLVRKTQKEQRQHLLRFQREWDKKEVYRDIYSNMDFEETVGILLANSKTGSLSEFFRKLPNISASMVAFLGLFDCQSLSEEDLGKLNLFEKVALDEKGGYFTAYEQGHQERGKIFLPYSQRLQEVIFSINLKEVSVDEYLKLFFQLLGERLLGNPKEKPQEQSAGRRRFYSLNQNRFLEEEPVRRLASRLVKTPEAYSQNDDRLMLLAFNLEGVSLYDEEMNFMENVPYGKDFSDVVSFLQGDAASGILKQQTSIRTWMDTWLFSKELKSGLLGLFRVKMLSESKDVPSLLNSVLSEAAYPFRFFSPDDVFARGIRPRGGISFLGDEEASIIFQILSWFPKGAFRGVELVAGKILEPEKTDTIPRSIEYYTTKEIQNKRMVEFFQSELNERLANYQRISGLSFKDGILAIDEVYLLGLKEEKMKSNKALLKNLIQWLGENRRMEIYEGFISSEKTKQFVKEMMKYLNVRLGQEGVDGLSDKLVCRFMLFDSLFLDDGERPTINRKEIV